MGKDDKKFFSSNEESKPEEVIKETEPEKEEVKTEEPKASASKNANKGDVMVEIGKDVRGNATWKLMSPAEAKKFYKK